MKKELMKNLCKIICMVGLILVHFNLSAQIEKTKTIDESFAVQKGALVQISHQKGDLHVKKSMTNKVETRLYVTVVGNREYRFTIERGARSFAKVIYDSCAYP